MGKYKKPTIPKQMPLFYTVLLAEDDPLQCKISTMVLERLGFAVVPAHDGYEAVKYHFERRIDLVLMDLRMPRLDGLEAIQIIRKQEQETGAHVPIFAVTASAHYYSRERCLTAGADEFLLKPYSPAILVEMAEPYLRGRKQ